MRKMLLVLCLCLVPGVSVADPFLVDVAARRVETPALIVRFNATCPERVDSLVFKAYGSSNLRGDSDPWEFHGQTIRGLWAGQGFIWPQSMVSQSWTVLHQDSVSLVVRVESTSTDEPPVRTDYRFFADAPYYMIDRTFFFSSDPQTTSFQVYVPRVRPTSVFADARYRDTNGAVQVHAVCFWGCSDPTWDRRWAEVCGSSIAVGIMYASTNVQTAALAYDYDSNSYASWVAPLVPDGVYDTDMTFRMLMTFSTDPSDLVWLDDTYAWFESYTTSSAPEEEIASDRCELKITPNPTAGATSVSFQVPFETEGTLTLLDVSGRRIATLLDGRLSPGPHVVPLPDRESGDGAIAPGVYFVRLSGSFGEATRKVTLLQ